MKNVIRLKRPENLDLEEIMRSYPHNEGGAPLRKEYLLYICHALLTARASQRKRKEDEGTDFTNLWSVLLDEVIHDYNRYVNYLIKCGVIECDNHFIKGVKSRGYRFSQKYSGVRIVTEEVDSYILKKKKRSLKPKRAEEAKKNTWGYGYLTKWLDKGKLQIDEEKAMLWIESYEEKKMIDLYLDDSVSDKADNLSIIIDTVEDLKNHVSSINDGSYNYSFSGEGHRLYNSLTNLKKELRTYLTYDGKPLVNIDIKNSQPFLSVVLHDAKFWLGLIGKGEKDNKWNKIKNREINKEICEYNITLLENAKTLTEKESGVENFIELVVDGKFYEYIQLKFEPIFPGRFDTRDKVKREVLRILYSNPEDYDKEFYYTCALFKHYFPVTFDLFCKIKSKNYKHLPLLLQRIESYLVIDVICKKISEEHPEIPLFTIHDSILSTQGNESIVEAFMTQEIKKFIGHEPKIAIEYLNPKEVKKESFSLIYA